MIFVFFKYRKHNSHKKTLRVHTPHGQPGGESERGNTENSLSPCGVFLFFTTPPKSFPPRRIPYRRVGSVPSVSRGDQSPRRYDSRGRPAPRVLSVGRPAPLRLSFIITSSIFFFVADAVLPDKHGTSISRAPSTHLARRQRSARVPLKDGASPL